MYINVYIYIYTFCVYICEITAFKHEQNRDRTHQPTDIGKSVGYNFPYMWKCFVTTHNGWWYIYNNVGGGVLAAVVDAGVGQIISHTVQCVCWARDFHCKQ